MAKKRILLGMLVVALALGMALVGCGDGSTPGYEPSDDRPSLPGSVNLDNYFPVVGETITARLNEQAGDFDSPEITNAIGTPSWRWYKTPEDQTSLWSATDKTTIGYSNTYTVKQSDVGFWIWAEVSYSGNRGTEDERTSSTAMGIPATATVSVSIGANYYTSYTSIDNHYVTVTLTLSDGRWNTTTSDVTDSMFGYKNPSGYGFSYSTASQWLTMSGIPFVSLWYPNEYNTPFVSGHGRELRFQYRTRSDTTLSISNLTATLNTAQLSTMRSNTNVYNTLTAGTSTASVSQWTIREY